MAKLKVEIIGDASSLHKALGDAKVQADGFGHKLGQVGKAAVLAAGAAGIGAVVGTLKVGYDEWKQSSLVAAQTAAVLKSTGGAAHVTAQHVDELASSLLRKTGIDDEQIKSTENMLLTFTSIRNEVGKDNDIFDQATKTATDMSVALGEDSKDAAIQLGKALNDPIRGVTALRRVGVQFTDAQMQQIKAMVDAGHTMQAQKLILGELNKEFGGSAEAAGKTLPGQLNILKETFRNVAGDIVGHLVPSLVSVTSWVTSKGLPGLQALGSKVSGVVQPAFAAFGSFVSSNLKPVLVGFWQVFQQDILPIWQRLAGVVGESIQKVSGVIHSHLPEIRTIFQNLGAVIKDVGIVAMPILKFAFTKVLPVALAVAIPVLKTITTIIRGVADVIADVVRWAGTLGSKLSDIPGALKGAFSGVASTLGGILKSPVNAVIKMIDAIHIPGFKIHVPLVGSIGWGGYTPFHIPMLAQGGIVSKPTLAVIGERGPEAVVPLNRGGVGGPNVTVNMTVHGSADADFARRFARELAVQLKGGRTPQLQQAITGLI